MTRLGGLAVLALVVAAAAGFVVWPRFESTPPEIEVAPEVVIGHEPSELTIVLRDDDSGLRSFQARLQTTSGARDVLSQTWPGSTWAGGLPGEQAVVLPLDPAQLQLPDGPSRLTFTARDWSLRDALAGNRTEHAVTLRVDTQPPRIEVESGLTYVYRGGSAAAVYRVEDGDVDGVQVGDTFFPGYPFPGDALGGGRRIALFAIPVEGGDPTVRVVARDRAGNESSAPFRAHVFERRFPPSDISLSEGFLQRVVLPLDAAHGGSGGDPVAAFQHVNEALRARNEVRIREVVTGSGPEPQWEGAFDQLANSKVTSRFAELRTYRVAGREVSQARHYGFDLASTSRAPITAGNAGTVLFADGLGIYGGCVILDHGLGLTSLYAHLSSIDVEEGQRVAKGQTLGRSGATGLAGGDHLHFAILLGSTYVDPMEWWDERWVRSHISVRME